MPGYGRRSRHRRRNHTEAHLTQRLRRRNLQLVAWSVGIGVTSAAALAVAFIFWLYPRLQDEQDPREAAKAASEAQVRVASKFKSPSRDEALALVKKALGLRNPAEVEALIRTGPMSALEVVNYLEAIKTVDGEITHYEWKSSIDKNGLSLEGVEVRYAGRDKPGARLAMLTPDAKGVWKLDFPAFARWGKPSWNALLEQDAESGVVRVVATKYNYFNGPFKDERVWAAYKLASPDTDQILVGYCKIGSAQQRAMELLWGHGETAVARVTLEIRRPHNAESWERIQFEISHVLAEDWVMSDKPLDEGL